MKHEIAGSLHPGQRSIDNAPAQALYRTCGYADVGVEPEHVNGAIRIRTGPIEVDDVLVTGEKSLAAPLAALAPVAQMRARYRAGSVCVCADVVRDRRTRTRVRRRRRTARRGRQGVGVRPYASRACLLAACTPAQVRSPENLRTCCRPTLGVGAPTTYADRKHVVRIPLQKCEEDGAEARTGKRME